MTPGEAATALSALNLSYPHVAKAAVRRAARRWRKLTIDDERQHGFIRTILGKYGASKWPPIVNTTKTTQFGDGFHSGLKLSGLSALQEYGGRILPHRCPNAFGRGKVVRHPGHTITPVPSAQTTLPQAEAFLAETMDKGVKRAIERAGLAD